MFPNQPDPTRDDPADPSDTITQDRAAMRYHQIRRLERQIVAADGRIATAKDKLSTLKEEREGLVGQLLAAARDEGDLPLFADL